jgi:hypothetical protein
MPKTTAERRAIGDLQQFVNDLCAANGGTVSHIDRNFRVRIPAGVVSRTDVHNTFLQLHPEHEAFRQRLSRVGMSNPHLCNDLWQAAKARATFQPTAYQPTF